MECLPSFQCYVNSISALTAILLKNVQIWCQKNRMVVNAEKTKVMLVTTYQRETKLQTSEMLENVNSEKCLVVIIDKHLETSY